MPTIKETETALDAIAQDPTNPRARLSQQRMGLSDRAIQAWSKARSQPDHPAATQTKNEIFKTISENLPTDESDPKAIGFWNRFAVKNLIDERPDLQQDYLAKKGFETRIKDGKVEFKKPDEVQFRAIDPEGFDKWDITDVLGDVLMGAAGVLGTGAKAMGLIGAPATGGASIVPGMLLGAGVETGAELTRQGIGMAIGARPELDKSRLTQAGLIGAAIPLAAPIVKGVASKVGEQAAKRLPELKANVKEIEAAAKSLGIKVTPGMKFDSKFIQNLESDLSQESGKIGGFMLRSTVKKNIKAAKEAAESVVKDATGRTAFETGDIAKKEIIENLAEKLKPAETIYDNAEKIFSSKKYKPDFKEFNSFLKEFAEPYKFNDTAIAKIKDFADKTKSVQNLTDLKHLRTQVRNAADVAYRAGDKETAKAMSDFANGLTRVRSDTLKALIDSNKPIAQTAGLGKAAIEKADAIYRSAADDVSEALLGRGKEVKAGVKSTATDVLERIPETEMINKVLKTNDPNKLAALKKSFPEAYQTLKTGKISEIFDRSTVKGEIVPNRVVKNLDKMPKESRLMIFGQDAEAKITALKQVINALPERIGPSGTPEGLAFKQIFEIGEQLKAAGRSTLLNSAEYAKKFTDIYNNTLKNQGLMDATRGAGFVGLRAAMPESEDKGFTTEQLRGK